MVETSFSKGIFIESTHLHFTFSRNNVGQFTKTRGVKQDKLKTGEKSEVEKCKK